MNKFDKNEFLKPQIYSTLDECETRCNVTKEIIEELIKVDYSKLNDDIIKDHLLDLYKDVKELEYFDWLPKKD